MTAKQIRELNDLMMIHNSDVDLGDILQGLIGEGTDSGTPVNAVNAIETLALTGVAIHGDSVTIDNPEEPGTDVYEFAADADQSVSDIDTIAVDITGYVGYAVGTLTMDTQPIAGDKVTIGTKVYTFVPLGTDNADGEVSVGADLAAAQSALSMAIAGDGTSTPHPLVGVTGFVGNDLVITALIGGTAGNAIATTTAFTAITNIFAAVTLGTGTNCSTANAKIALMAAITASDTQGVGATSAAGTTILLTSDVAGQVGNSIVLAEDLTNGNFVADAVNLSGGVDGTVAPALKLIADATYLYFTLVANTTAGKNWRRMALGAAY